MASVRVLFVARDTGSIPRVPARLESRNGRLSVRIATAGRDALDRVETVDEACIDCVVTERLAATGEPFGFVEWIRSVLPSVPIVLFPPDGDEDLASEAFARDVADYVPKRDDSAQYDRLAAGVLATVESCETEVLGTPATNDAVEPVRDGYEATGTSATGPASPSAAPARSGASAASTDDPQWTDADEARFRALFDQLPEPAVRVAFRREAPIVRSVNCVFTETFGYDSAEIRDEPLADYVLDSAEDETTAFDGRVAETGQVRTVVKRRTRDGDRYFLVRGVTYRLDDGVEGVGIYTDITKRMTRERQLQILNRVLRYNLRADMDVIIDRARSIDDGDGDRSTHVGEIVETARSAARVGEDVRTLAAALETSSWEEWEETVTDAVELVELATAPYAVRDDVDLSLDLPHTAPVTADERLVPAIDVVLGTAIERADRTPTDISIVVDPTFDDVTEIVCELGQSLPSVERTLFSIGPDTELDLERITQERGLGLWIVNWIVTALGGETSIEVPDSTGAADDGESPETVVRMRIPSGCQLID